jgi:eukaryotic-like serine/threonine-protein kinase
MFDYPSSSAAILLNDPQAHPQDAELRAHLERVLAGVYDLDYELGRGGMGVVYKAKDRRLKRDVAVKVLPPELGFRAEIRQRFLREAETAAQLTHPNIVPIYSVDERDGLVFFVMALVEGDNLGQLIHKYGAMDPERVRKVLREVADALSYAHQRHVVHRDIKPDNILLDPGSGRPLVTDFGIARAISEGADARLTATGIAIGTPAYMSPEQSAGDKVIDGRTDLYALGVVAYQMLSGELPFIASSTPAMLVKHLSETPTPVQLKRRGIPADLAQIVMCLLEKDPSDRFESAEALVSALDGAGPVPVARPHAPRPLTTGWNSTPAPVEPDTAALLRWNAPVVSDFRKRLAPYLVVNGVFVVLNILNGPDFMAITAIWTVFLAFRYSKLWAEGYDWRDVFRQPRDRLLLDVVSETVDDLKGLTDVGTRETVRAKWRAKRQRPGLMEPVAEGRVAPAYREAEMLSSGSALGEKLSRAARDRDELGTLYAALSDADRKSLGEVPRTADALLARIRGLVATLAELERVTPTGAETVALDREIALLESQANPLDREASEARIRRLAMLKRDRRALQSRGGDRAALEGKLESCLLALQNLRYDVVRLASGGVSTQSVTQVAARAMALADDVDALVKARGKSAPSP